MCYYNEGYNTEIAYVFSCPGRNEEKQGKPVAGKTGENLDILIQNLAKNKNVRRYFDKTMNRYDFRITNTFPKVLYKKKDGRSEPKMSEIKTSENIERLKKELEGFSIIIFFGKKAQEVCKWLDLPENVIVVKACHLGMQGLNHIYLQSSVPKNDRTNKRLKLVTEQIVKEIKRQKL